MLYVLSWLIGTKDGVLSSALKPIIKMHYALSWLIGTKDGVLSLALKQFFNALCALLANWHVIWHAFIGTKTNH